MIEIPIIGSDRPALVDDDFQWLLRYRWRLDKDGYPFRRHQQNRLPLHHIVLPKTNSPNLVRDHINRDKLDSRRANLRWVTKAQNTQNRSAAKKNTTGLRGVMRIGSRYRATATIDGVIHRFGMFDDPFVAAAILAEWRRTHMPFSSEG
jgi:hypothetical protein